MNREAILDICGVKEVFEVPQALMKKLFSHEQSDLLDRIRLVEKMVIDSRRTSVNVDVINKCDEYIRVLSNAIQMMEEVNDYPTCSFVSDKKTQEDKR